MEINEGPTTLYQWYSILRQELALLLLASGKFTSTAVAYEMGYTDVFHFSRSFMAIMGFRPSDWQQHIAG